MERQRLAVEEGAKAIQEVAERAIAIRENMARLRALRQAKEDEAVRTAIPNGNQPARAKSKKRFG